ncbi:T9SS type A sorting domain-containing protein [Hymenobacter sp. BT175]|uniref:T9SS type A sorting domain-containing protein n=1 Tax=Hymenobacter translucens TaxID=2886507 RepID=UPI001D0DC0B2|nr:T9SS type A sorting domain-containing protein [Hymenobacter translucens]MCC2546660.1 T9SS type A sorting domain-containing protein [Hymenobacter translucens]
MTSLLHTFRRPLLLVVALMMPMFAMALATEPTVQPTVSVSPTKGLTGGTASFVVTLSGGNGTNNLIVVRPTANAVSLPQDGTGYYADTQYGNGVNLGFTNNFVVSNASAATTSVVVTGLTGKTSYTVMVYAFNDDNTANGANYLTTGAASATVVAPSTYYFNFTDDRWNRAAAWTPSRASVGTGSPTDPYDILVFDGTRQATTEAVPYIVDYNAGNGSNHDEIEGQLFFINGIDIRMNAPATGNDAGRIVLDGGYSGADFVVENGATLIYSATSNTNNRYLEIYISTGETASVAGNMSMTSANTSATLTHRFFGADAGAIQFLSGSTFTNTAIVVGNPFGASAITQQAPTSTPAATGSVVFNSGATFQQNGGVDPFGTGAPITSFLAGSTYNFVGGTFSALGQQYGNLNMQAAVATTVAGPANFIVLNNLTITQGTVALNVTGNGPEPGVSISGNLAVNGGSLSVNPAAEADLMFVGTTEQFISGTAPLTIGSLSYLGIRNPAGVTLQRPITTLGKLYLVTGRFNTTATNILSMPATSTIVAPGGLTNVQGNTSFVNGPMIRTLSAAGQVATNPSNGTGLFFPIGAGAFYRPLALTVNQATATATNYTAQMINGEPTQLTLGGEIRHISRKRYYDLSTNGASSFSNGQLTIYYGLDDEVDAPSKLRIARSNGSAWDNAGNSNTSTSNDGVTSLVGSITSSNPFSALGNFILASTEETRAAGNNPLPVTLTSLTAEAKAAGVLVAWATASEKNNDRYEVQRSQNGREFQTVGTVKGSGTTSVAQRYSFVDETAPAGTLYYRLRQVDADGTVALSGIAIVKKGAVEATVYPNPAHGFVNLQAGAESVQWRLLNLQGRSVQQGTATGETRIELQSLPAGTYMLEIISGGQRTVQKVAHLN